MITFKPTLSYNDRLWAMIQVIKTNPKWAYKFADTSDDLVDFISQNLSLDKEQALKELDDYLEEISISIDREALERGLSVQEYLKTQTTLFRTILKYAFKVSNK